MTETVKRASTRTVLRLGEVEAPVGLFKITTNPAARKWDTPPDDGDGTESKGSPLAAGGAKPSRGAGSASGRPVAGEAAAPPPPKPKGVMKPDGSFVDLTQHIADIAEKTTLDCLEVAAFIDRRQVPRERILGAYYVGAGSGEGFPPSRVIGLLFRAMKDRNRAAVVRWGKRTRSSVGVMIPHGSGALVVLELAYAEHVLAPNPDCLTHQHIDISDEEVNEAVKLIDAMAARRDSLDNIHDHRTELEDELVTRAEHGEVEEFQVSDAPVEDEAWDLGALLKRSVEAAEAAKA